MNIKNFDLLKKLFLIHSPSGKEGGMIEFISNWSEKNNTLFEIDEKGNIYLTKGSGLSPCVVAHMDTVFKVEPEMVVTHVGKDRVIAYNMNTGSQCGLGADDKVGVYMALQMVNKFDNIKAVLTVEEETGCVGAKEVDLTFFEDVSLVLQADRKGYGEFVCEATNSSFKEIKMYSQEFSDEIQPYLEYYGFKESNNGGSTDVVNFKSRGLGVSSVNVSCGYYNPHQSTEYIIKSEVGAVEQLFVDIIEDIGFKKKWSHKSEPVEKTTYNYNSYNNTNYSYNRPITAPRYHSLDRICEDVYNKMEKVGIEDVKDLVFFAL